MIVDTIYKIDTVFAEKANEYLTKGEVIDLFDKVHSFHNDEYTDFLTELGILITILIVVVGLVNYSKVKSIEKRLDDKIEEFDNRITKTIDSKIKEGLKVQVTQYENKFSKELKISLENISNEKDYSLNILKAHNYMNIFKYKEAIEKLIMAAEMALKVDNKEYFTVVLNNINAYRNKMTRLKREGKSVSINKIFASEVNKLFLFTKNENENLEFVSQIKHHLEYINKEFK